MADEKNQKELSCRDFRMDCDFTVRGRTEEELLRECREHACSAHGKCSTSPGAEAKIRSRIRDVWS